MPRFKTVFFDVGGTLLHMGEPLAAYRDILAEHGYDVDATRVGEALGEARRVAAAVPSGPLPDGTILPERESLRRDAMVRALLERLGVEEDFEACRKAIWDSWLGTRVFHQFSEVRPVLARLKRQGYALVAVSNWEPRLETLCANHGLREFFDFVLASEAEGYAKPGPFLFRKALQLTGAMPAEVVHVGDNYFEDVQAALSLGIAAVLVDRAGMEGVHSPVIRSLEHLFPLLDAEEWIQGYVVSGSGEAARFTALSWVREQMRERLGFVPYPGTFNLRPASPRDRAAFARLKSGKGLGLEAQPGYCAARCFPVILEGQWPGALVVPEVPGYPDDKLEVLAPNRLRDALSVSEGRLVTVTASENEAVEN